MVARPSLSLRIEPMRIEDLPAVHAIERAQLRRAVAARRVPARARDEPPGASTSSPGSATRSSAYGGMWLMVDEAHITTFAVHPDWRRQHIGERLLLAFLDLAVERGAHEATLEVRLSNLPARRLYEKFGFRPVGLRPRYYSDDGEDALIMTTEPLADAAMRERLARLRAALDAAPAPRPADAPDDAPADEPPADERPARSSPSSRRATRPASRSSRAAGGSARTSSRSQVALHAPSGGIVPEVAARAHLRWIVPVLDEAWADAGAAGTTSTRSRSRTGPGLAGSLLVGINFAKALAWVHDLPLVGVNHLEGHVYAAWLRDPGEADDAPSRSSRSSRWSSRGGHTFLVEMRDHLTYRLLGATVDDAAGEAFDKVGRLLGLGYPGGPAISRAAEAATRARPRSSRGPGWATRTTSASPASRPPPGGSSPRPGPTRASGRRPDEPLPDDGRRRARLGLPGRGRRRPRRPRRSGPPRPCGARSIVLGGGVAANGVLRARLAGRGGRARHPARSCREPALCTDNGAMIGAAGARRFAAGERAGLDLDARPSLPLASGPRG